MLLLALPSTLAFGQAFTVTSTSPAMNALDVATNANITINFSDPVNAANINSNASYPNVIVTGSLSGRHSIVKNTSLPAMSVIFDPDQDFLPGEIVTLKILYDVSRESDGYPLGVSKQYSFTVASGGTGVGYFTTSASFTGSTTGQATKIYPVDYNKDGDVDIVSMKTNSYIYYASKNNAVDSYTAATYPINMTGVGNLVSLAFSDMNRDGYIDIVGLLSPGGAGITTARVGYNYFGSFNDVNETTAQYPSGSFNTTNNAGLLIADVNMDSYDDFIVRNTGLTGVVPFYSNSGTSFSQGNSTLLANTTTGDWVAADLNNDGYPDFVGVSGPEDQLDKDTVGVILSTGSNAYAAKTVYRTNTTQAILGIALGDVDGDGDIDIVAGDNAYSNNITVFKNNGSGSFTTQSTTSLADRPKGMKLGDMDGDGDLDVVYYSSTYVYVSYNNGSGVFNSHGSYSLASGMTTFTDLAVCDADGDGDLDAVLNDPNNSLFRVYKNSVVTTPTSTGVYSISVQQDYGNELGMFYSQGDGSKRIVVVKQGSAVDVTPSDNTTYTANSTFGSGSDLGGGNYVVYNGNDYVYSIKTLSNLSYGGTYYFAVFEYNGPSGLEKYLTSSYKTASSTTSTTPNSATVNTFTKNYGSSAQVNWSNGGGKGRIVVMKQGSAVDVTPTNSTTYTANAAFGSGTDLGGGNYVVFNGNNTGDNFVNVTGLSTSTTYHVAVFEYFGGTGTEIYGSPDGEGSPGRGNVTTSATAGYPFDTTAGYAFRYNNNGYSSANNSFAIPDGFTYELWTSPASVGTQMVILDHGDEYVWIAIDATGKFFGRVYDDNASNNVEITGTTTAVAGQWYHLALTGASGSPLKLYVNGVLEATSGGNIGALMTGGQWLYPGTDNMENYYLSGDLDELRIWNSVRTVEQIRENMHKTLSGTPSQLVGYWQFNEGTGSSVAELVNDNSMNQGGASWIASGAPVGGATISNGSVAASNNGPHTVGNATLSMTDGFDNPVDVYVSELTADPSNYPTGYGSSVGGKYFVINLFGDPGTFSTSITLNFGSGVITAGQEADPSSIQLFKRESNSSGTWTQVGGAISASASTGEVTWSGITSFSQFLALTSDNELPPSYTLTKADNADWTVAENQDRITDSVWLTRADNRGMFNIQSEAIYDDNSYSSPTGTEWAVGTTNNIESLTFTTWREAAVDYNNNNGVVLNQDLVVHLIADDIYLDIKFTAWTQNNNGGGFSYTRSLKPLELIQSGYADLAPTSVTVSGQIYSKTTTATAYVLYGTTSGTYTDSALITPNTIPADTVYSISQSLTGLTDGTTYYYRFSASNGSIYARSSERSVRPHTIQVWDKDNGTITFTKSNNADYTQSANQDRINGDVWLTRSTDGIFNIKTESSYNSSSSPDGTEWAIGTIENYESLTFSTWYSTHNGNPASLIGQDMVVHIIAEDIYLDIKLLSWGDGESDNGFSYIRASAPLAGTVTQSSDVFSTTATVYGTVYSTGYNATAQFLYGTSSGTYTDSVATTPASINANSSTVVSADLTSLTPGTLYYVAIAAQNDTLYRRGSEATVMTMSSAPGNSLLFDGSDDYVSIADANALDMTTTYTLEAWIKPNGFSSMAGIISKYHSNGANGYFIRLSNDPPFTGIRFDEFESASGILSAGNWYHIAAVNNNGTRTLYVNGNSVSISGGPFTTNSNSDHVAIGSDFGGRYFNGVIDEVRIWNVARTQQEIQDNMNLPFTSAQSGLVGYWQLNAGTGTIAHGHGSSAGDGTLTNFNFNGSSGWLESAAPLPVELVSFTASSQRLNAELKWKTATELNNHGYEIERTIVSVQKSQGKDAAPTKSWSKVGFLEGSGTSNAPKEYTFTDKVQKAGKYSYRLKQIDRDGKFSYSQAVEVNVGAVPLVFALEQNYPNPFNPSTTIGFTLQESGKTTLKIYDAIGREVVTLVDEVLEAGAYHQQIFDASRFASGVYFARLVSGSKVQVKKLMLMK
ncbi:MAG: LamG-like jellyroll fold domain-containing protein [Bacteroidota bacterium]